MKWPSRSWDSDICSMKPKFLLFQAFMDVCLQGHQLRNRPEIPPPEFE